MESLPNEIIQVVMCSVKNLHDIRSCRGINSKWNYFATKELHKRNHLVGFTENSELSQFLSVFNQTSQLFPFSRFSLDYNNCYVTHQLKIQDVKLFFKLHGSHIRELQLRLPKPKDSYDSDDYEYPFKLSILKELLPLLESTPNLIHFQLQPTATSGYYGKIQKIVKLIPSLLKLKTLEFYLDCGEFHWKLPLLQGLIFAAPNLQNLNLKFSEPPQFEEHNSPQNSLKHLGEIWEVVKDQVPCVSVTRGQIEFRVRDPRDIEFTKQNCGFTGLRLQIDKIDEAEFANELGLFRNWLEFQSGSLKGLLLNCYTQNFWLPKLSELTTLEVRFKESEREPICSLQPLIPADFPKLGKVVLDDYSNLCGLFKDEVFPSVKEFCVGPAYDGLKSPVNWDEIFPKLEILQLDALHAVDMKPFIERMTNVIELKFYGSRLEQFCDEESHALQKILGRNQFVWGGNEDAGNRSSLLNFTKLKRIRFDSGSILIVLVNLIEDMKSLELITICPSLSNFYDNSELEIMSILKSFNADVTVEPPETGLVRISARTDILARLECPPTTSRVSDNFGDSINKSMMKLNPLNQKLAKAQMTNVLSAFLRNQELKLPPPSFYFSQPRP